jgi:hypothetical protein
MENKGWFVGILCAAVGENIEGAIGERALACHTLSSSVVHFAVNMKSPSELIRGH